jgi:C-terminal processing protease CtpA/Prc
MHRLVATPLVLALCLATCRDKTVVSAYPDLFVGVGLELTVKDGTPVVVRVLPGSSGGEAGVAADDRLIAVDGVPTQGKSLGDVVMSVRGRPDTQVTLTLLRREVRHVVVVRRRAMAKTGKDYERKP